MKKKRKKKKTLQDGLDNGTPILRLTSLEPIWHFSPLFFTFLAQINPSLNNYTPHNMISLSHYDVSRV